MYVLKIQAFWSERRSCFEITMLFHSLGANRVDAKDFLHEGLEAGFLEHVESDLLGANQG